MLNGAPFGLNEKLKTGGNPGLTSNAPSLQLSQTLHPPTFALLHVVAPGGQNVDRPGQRRFPLRATYFSPQEYRALRSLRTNL